MPEYLSPGVYIEEVNTGPRPIEGVGTAMAAFVGFAPYGKANAPVLITNWTQYVREFGTPRDERGNELGPPEPHQEGAYLSHAVYGFFLNGGGRCYVTRVAPASANGKVAPPATAELAGRGAKDVPVLVVTAKGGQSADIKGEIAPPTGESPPEGAFTLKLSMGEAQESYENVTMTKRSLDGVTRASKLVALAEAATAAQAAERVPEVGSFTLKAPSPLGAPKVQESDLVGSVVERTGLEGMEIAEDVTMICCPDLMSAYQQGLIDRAGVKAVQTAMINHCERNADRVAILDSLPDMKPQEVYDWRMKGTNYDSMFAALYYPWISVMGPRGKPIAIPPCGHIAGIWARNDSERGVHKAPANEIVRGALESTYEITKGEQDVLNPDGVNCIRTFAGRGLRVWGARTLSSDPAWRYINVRRLFNYIEKSIERGTQWVVFEPNDPNLWARVRRDVGAFLTVCWRDGMLFGLTPQEAFYVKCDAELNPPEIRDQGKLIIEVGLAPVKPAEFVIFRFSQFAGGGV